MTEPRRLGWLLVLALAGVMGMLTAWTIAQFVDPRSLLVFEWCSFVPSGAIVLGAGFLGWWAGRRRARRWSRVGWLLVLVFGVRAASEQRWSRSATETPSDSITLMHWNVCRGWFLDSVIQRVKERDADLWVLAEVPEEFDPARFGVAATWRIDNLLFGCSRGRWNTRAVEPIYGTRVHAAEWSDGEDHLLVCAVDIDASILNSRARLLDTLAEHLTELKPDVLVGDFNTPRDSPMFAPVRQQLRHAYEVAGSGWSGTWPLPLPVFAIDHIFVGPAIEAHDYRLFSEFCSDHRGQLLEFTRR